ncbi:hypothetical protein [Spongiimicrobium salis]|uniref:hypothetical protein n=1 Tax=Spongiimicrobium salis TaxID=1667022 RepID=UPI00374C9388
MKHSILNIGHDISSKLWGLLLCFILGFSVQATAQTSTPKVTSKIDTTSIKIGEQINFKVTVEVDSTAQVVFPEGQTFLPLEMVEAILGDTIKNQDRITLERIYALTQFDSGAYTLPQQKITIDDKTYFTDSIRVAVSTIAVDTVSKEFYDIKPLINVEKSSNDLWMIFLWIFLTLALVAGLLYWFVWRKKPLTEEEKVALLPPYDRAMLELKNLENSKYLIQDEYKEYYSELTTIVRSYLEEDAKVSALESTTDQLIEKLEVLKDAGELDLNSDTINQFKRILQTADLVKFAKSKPQTSVAEHDRKTIEQIVTETKEALPEPTLEDLLKTEAYLEELAQKKKRKKIWITAIVAAFVLVASGVSATAYYGFAYVKDTIIGHPTKELLEGEWVASTYGAPPISIETPKVLLRQEVELPPEASEIIDEMQLFMYRSAIGLFTVGTSSITLKNQEEPDYEQAVDQWLKSFEQQGAKNIITKQEEFTTLSGVVGIKMFGTGKFAVAESKELVNGEYAILIFGGKGFQQQVILTWLDDDSYAEEIIDRILDSVDVKTEL